MMKIWTETGFVENDPWVIETEEIKADEQQKPLLDLEAFLAKAQDSNDTDLGVVIQPADDVMRLQPYLDRLAIVAVSFPAFSDGRGFSHASLLRSRLDFRGEVRAVGDVLIDQVPLMLRTGFTSFAVVNETAIRRLTKNRLPGIAVHYQPAAKSSVDPGSYSWRRKAAS